MTAQFSEDTLAKEMARELDRLAAESSSEMRSLVVDIENASEMIASIERVIAENVAKRRKIVADRAGYKARLAALASEG